jgi:hypothetical protein
MIPGKLLRLPIVLVVLTACLTSPAPQTFSVSPPPFLPESELLVMRDRQDTHAMRKHAWTLFGWLTQPSQPRDPSSFAIWQTWYQEADVLGIHPPSCTEEHPTGIQLNPPGENFFGYLAGIQKQNNQQADNPKQTGEQLADQGLAKPVKFLHSQGTTGRHGKLIFGTDVLYNTEACEHLLLAHGLAGRAASSRKSAQEKEIPPFPNGSVAVKAMWDHIFVHPDGVHRNQFPVRSRESQGAPQVTVTLARPGELCDLSSLTATGEVSTACFYSVVVTAQNVGEIARDDATVGDVYILLGLHVMTKEIPDWVWSTFWWSPQPAASQFADDRPREGPLHGYAIRGPWRNYLMDTTLSMETPREPDPPALATPPPGDNCGDASTRTRAKICYNPYIETPAMPNYSHSNCMNCHAHATIPGMNRQGFDGFAVRGFISPNAPCFAGRARTDYNWALSN